MPRFFFLLVSARSQLLPTTHVASKAYNRSTQLLFYVVRAMCVRMYETEEKRERENENAKSLHAKVMRMVNA